jgi:hypothetical protein
MKKKIIDILNNLNLTILRYKTYRSDMGCQVYEVYATNGVENHLFNDSYFVGAAKGQQYILTQLRA